MSDWTPQGPDWEGYVRKHLRSSGIPPRRADVIISELAEQLDEAYREHLSGGASPEEAVKKTLRLHIPSWEDFRRRLAEAERKHRAPAREQPGRTHKRNWLEDFRLDGKHFLRNLRRHPSFAVAVVLTLALGIGANTAIFSVVNGILLGSLPFADPDSLVMVWEHSRKTGNQTNVVSPANFADWRERSSSFENFSAFYYRARTLTGRGHPQRILGINVIGDFFAALRIEPQMGRTFPGRPDDLAQVVVSHAFWQSHLGGDSGVLGQSLILDGKTYKVVGVLPPGPVFPPSGAFWIPTAVSNDYFTSRGRFLRVLARLRESTTHSRAQAEMDAIATQLERQHPEFNKDYGINVVSLKEQFAGSLGTYLILLQAVVGIVLLIACANVANLTMSRISQREAEFGMRRALGASRGRLLRQLVSESTLLAVLGGVLGTGLAFYSLPVIAAIVPSDTRTTFAIALDYRVLGFALLTTLSVGGLTGLLPFSQLKDSSLMQRGRPGQKGRRGSRLSDGLVIAEVGLALVLLVAAGLTIRSLIELNRIDPGFDSSRVLALSTQLPDSLSGGIEGPAAEAQAGFYRRALEDIAAIPGVESVGAINFLPVDAGSPSTHFFLADRPRPQPGEAPVADILTVAGGYFQTLGIPLEAGRHFDEQDHAGAPKAVIVNQTAAQRYWPDQNPLGKRVIMPWNGIKEGQVVGVVGDVRQRGLSRDARPTIYWREEQFTYGFMTLVVRSSLSKPALSEQVREKIAALRPGIPVFSIQSMEEVLSESVAFPRTINTLISSFALLALLLAMIGLYGLISRWVARRFQEIGIRMALGAGWGDILHLVVGKAMLLTLLGLTLGLLGSLGLSSLGLPLFGVESTDPLAYAGACILLAGAAFLAAFLPARKAAHVDPVTVIRGD